MPTYLIGRDIPGAGELSPGQLKATSRQSCAVLDAMGPQIQWLQSHVTGDRVYCIYSAPDEDTVREHARQGGFPANRVSQIAATINPTTASQAAQPPLPG
jgi:hypothetical protein